MRDLWPRLPVGVCGTGVDVALAVALALAGPPLFPSRIGLTSALIAVFSRICRTAPEPLELPLGDMKFEMISFSAGRKDSSIAEEPEAAETGLTALW